MLNSLQSDLALALVHRPYSPLLVVPVPQVAASVTGHEEYQEGCASGYNDYFESMFDFDTSGDAVIVSRCYSSADVSAYVLDNVLSADGLHGSSVFYHLGFVHGWLSVLHLIQPVEALYGFQLFVKLAHHLSLSLGSAPSLLSPASYPPCSCHVSEPVIVSYTPIVTATLQPCL